VTRTNQHIYASVISADGRQGAGERVNAEVEVRNQLASVQARAGTRMPRSSSASALRRKPRQRASNRWRSTAAGFRYHGRVKALADARVKPA